MRRTILILNGPGLPRQSAVTQIEEGCGELCAELGLELDFRQAEDEATLNRWMQKDGADFDAIIVNPSGCPASSLDPVAGQGTPVIEVHLENIFKPGGNAGPRISGPAGVIGFICGFGHQGYTLAIRSLARRLQSSVSA